MVAIKFEWDAKKASSNLAKHGVSFDEASSAFADPSARLIPDPDHSNSEVRHILLGFSSSARLLLVSHSIDIEHMVVRIISVRKATKKEGLLYEERRNESGV